MNRLTQELLDMVAGYLPLGERVVTNSPARKWGVSQCASVSRAWQSSVERCTFRSFSVEDRDLSVLSTLLSTARRINSVRFLTYQILVDWEVAEEWIVDCYVRHKLWELLIWLSGLGMSLKWALKIVLYYDKPQQYRFERQFGWSAIRAGPSAITPTLPNVGNFAGSFDFQMKGVHGLELPRVFLGPEAVVALMSCFPSARGMNVGIMDVFRSVDTMSRNTSGTDQAARERHFPEAVDMASRVRALDLGNLQVLTMHFDECEHVDLDAYNRPTQAGNYFALKNVHGVNAALGELCSRLRVVDLQGCFVLTREFFETPGVPSLYRTWPHLEKLNIHDTGCLSWREEESARKLLGGLGRTRLGINDLIPRGFRHWPPIPQERQRLDMLLTAIVRAMLGMPRITEVYVEFDQNPAGSWVDRSQIPLDQPCVISYRETEWSRHPSPKTNEPLQKNSWLLKSWIETDWTPPEAAVRNWNIFCKMAWERRKES